MNIHDATGEMRRLSNLLEQALADLQQWSQTYAEAENAYRMARATALLEATGTVPERNARADLATPNERQASRIADGMRQASLEAVRSRRAQISALQSVIAGHRAEAEFARLAP